MSYYILPTINNNITLQPITSKRKLTPVISQSLHTYYNESKRMLIDICLNDPDLSFNVFTDYLKIINPYEYIYSKVPGSKFSVGKFKPKSNIFYEILEILTTLNVCDVFNHDYINTLHIGKNSSDSVDCLEIVRDGFKDNNLNFDAINNELYKKITDNRFDFLFMESDRHVSTDLNIYVISLLKTIMIILRNQICGGTAILKVDYTFHKPIVDILYILSSLYEKVIIIKPNTSNVTTFEKYIVCKNFKIDDEKNILYKQTYNDIFFFMRNYKDGNITSLFEHAIPIYFMNKLNDINIIIGQQQLESIDQIINILKNKNRYEKIEHLKKTNIQRSVNWCEKYKIPCNKFTEKTNIFLPLHEEEIET